MVRAERPARSPRRALWVVAVLGNQERRPKKAMGFCQRQVMRITDAVRGREVVAKVEFSLNAFNINHS